MVTTSFLDHKIDISDSIRIFVFNIDYLHVTIDIVIRIPLSTNHIFKKKKKSERFIVLSIHFFTRLILLRLNKKYFYKLKSKSNDRERII